MNLLCQGPQEAFWSSLRLDAQWPFKTFSLGAPSSAAWTSSCLRACLPASRYSRFGHCPGVIASFLTTEPALFGLPSAGTLCWVYHLFLGLLSLFTSSDFGYFKCLNVLLYVFLNSFESLHGPRSFTVLSILSEVVKKVLFVPGPWIMNLPHQGFSFESAPFEYGCSASDVIFTWEIHLSL